MSDERHQEIKIQYYLLFEEIRFLFYIPSIPTFHFSIIPCGLQKTTVTKRAIIPISRINPDTLYYIFINYINFTKFIKKYL